MSIIGGERRLDELFGRQHIEYFPIWRGDAVKAQNPVLVARRTLFLYGPEQYAPCAELVEELLAFILARLRCTRQAE